MDASKPTLEIPRADREALDAAAAPRFIPATEYAGPYKSPFLEVHRDTTPLLSHVNCSYLSTRGVAPTLNNLKQHAQALCILIKHLTTSTSGSHINGADPNLNKEAPEKEAIQEIRSFDFLENLNQAYDNEAQDSHVWPLTACMNTLEDRGAVSRGGRNHCALHRVTQKDEQEWTPSLPYATTQALLQHADEILERLDHEFSSEGGLLGIVPIENSPDSHTEYSRRSILGQWVTFTRQLVTRCHELANGMEDTLKILGGEAVVPRQLLDSTSLNDRQDDLKAVQDQWMLCVPDHALEAFEQAFSEAELKPFDPENDEIGSGAGQEDLITLQVKTTYARLRGGRTIFVVPTAIEEQPKKRGVVAVVKPEWRPPGSDWERRHGAELSRLRRLEHEEHAQALDKIMELEAGADVLWREKERLAAIMGTNSNDILKKFEDIEKWEQRRDKEEREFKEEKRKWERSVQIYEDELNARELECKNMRDGIGLKWGGAWGDGTSRKTSISEVSNSGRLSC